jgi:nucleoside 2-deoxyribosyltransferase
MITIRRIRPLPKHAARLAQLLAGGNRRPSATPRPRVYLAGPMVFAPEPEAIFARMKHICASAGLEGVSPLDNQLGLEGATPGHMLAERIVRADIALMHALNGGLFCLDGIRRGAEMDAGTAFEVGYMAALGKKLVGWTRDGRDYPQKVADYFGGALQPAAANAQGGMSGSRRDPDGLLVHSEGCVQNAMVHVGIELAGGTVCCDPNWEVAFTAAAEHLARQFMGAG